MESQHPGPWVSGSYAAKHAAPDVEPLLGDGVPVGRALGGRSGHSKIKTYGSSMNRLNPQQGSIARWLYGGGPGRLMHPVGNVIHRIPPAAWRGGAIAVGVAGMVVAAVAFWPKPLEYGVPAEGVSRCLAAMAEIPTEYAARMFYPRCLAARRDEARVQRWQRYHEQIRLREMCIYAPGRPGADCPPEPPKPAE